VRVLDLFSGIGGFSLGLERAGYRTVAFCEIDAWCRSVLAHHWPGVPCYTDIRELSADRLARDGIEVDAMCGGFPCQDISVAGAGAGIDGTRSGLWGEYARLIGELRPADVYVENVSALLARGLERVLGDLAALGYDAEWHCIPASAVGAPHRRDRVWIVAHSRSRLAQLGRAAGHMGSQAGADEGESKERQRLRNAFDNGRQALAYANESRLEGLGRLLQRAREQSAWKDGEAIEGGRLVKPGLRLLAHGVPERVAKLRAFGNAVVPQIPEILGRAVAANGDNGA
jgi:DNA (cytosine-5)-methyltransferase 1